RRAVPGATCVPLVCRGGAIRAPAVARSPDSAPSVGSCAPRPPGVAQTGLANQEETYGRTAWHGRETVPQRGGTVSRPCHNEDRATTRPTVGRRGTVGRPGHNETVARSGDRATTRSARPAPPPLEERAGVRGRHPGRAPAFPLTPNPSPPRGEGRGFRQRLSPNTFQVVEWCHS